METIFSHNVTKEELRYFFVELNTEEMYLKRRTKKEEILRDLAELFEIRENPIKAKEYWAQIPDEHQEYLLCLNDDVIIPE